MLFINSTLDKTNDDILTESILSKISSAATSIKTKTGEVSENIGISSVTWDKVIERYEARINDIENQMEKLKLINDIDDEFKVSTEIKSKIDSFIEILASVPEKVKAYKVLRSQISRYESSLRTLRAKAKSKKIVNSETKATDKAKSDLEAEKKEKAKNKK